MKVVILAAMDKEISLLINLLNQPQEKFISNIKVWEGSLNEKQVYVAKCGIGKVNSALNTYKLIQAVTPDLIINSGVAGGAGIPIGTLLVAHSVAYHDVWCGPGTEYGQADGIPLFMTPSEAVAKIAEMLNLRQGLICSGDKFISNSEEINFIRQRFPEVNAVDMESASIAQTCIMADISFAIIRVVSDTPGEGENISQYQNFWNEAPEKTFRTIKEIINRL